MDNSNGDLEGEPTPEELAMAQSGLPALALAWVGAVRRGDIDSVWLMTDPQFRLGLAQMWIWHNRDAVDQDLHREGISRDELAEQLVATDTPRHPLWVHCARVSMRTISKAAGDLDGELASGTRPRPVGPGLELIRLFPLDRMPADEHGNRIFPPGMSVEALSLVMRLADDQWKVAGIGHHLLQPGWPPTFEEVATGSD